MEVENTAAQNESVKRKKTALELNYRKFRKTQTSKINVYMINFYVDLAGHDMVTDTCRATARRCKIKPLSF